MTIAKSYIGVGCLAIPYGFNLCGYQLGLLLLVVSAVLTFFCCWFMTEASKFYGKSEIKAFSDFGKILYGRTGHIIVFAIYYTNQYCTCICYVIFFLDTFREYFKNIEPRFILFALMAVLVVLSLVLKSMKDIQKL
jgi:amino acid permease